MKDLIAKLEAATEGLPELDALIVTTLCKDAMVGEYIKGDGYNTVFHARELGIADKSECPHFTTSIDAALTLVPEGWQFDLISAPGQMDWTCALNSPDFRGEMMPGQGGEEYVTVVGRRCSGIQRPTPALAICIAALKAQGGQK